MFAIWAVQRQQIKCGLEIWLLSSHKLHTAVAFNTVTTTSLTWRAMTFITFLRFTEKYVFLYVVLANEYVNSNQSKITKAITINN